ncbi:hypothetical protein ABEG18_19140 [Alsobacter sp. KACC 23698]|uniref:Uncharacterized protein n=1 Tax=Alsobacter sp. KACC 23698 TaxID=3149229 RepID=A0AAU7JBR0_9HYPH
MGERWVWYRHPGSGLWSELLVPESALTPEAAAELGGRAFRDWMTTVNVKELIRNPGAVEAALTDASAHNVTVQPAAGGGGFHWITAETEADAVVFGLLTARA